MATRARVVAPLALAALSAVAGLSLGRVFDSGRYALPVLGAALVPHAVGALGRRLHWSTAISVTVTLVVIAAFVLWALEPSTTWLGLPSAATIDALDRQLRGGWHVLRTAPAPAPVTDGTRLLAVLATAAVATIADWLAFRRLATLGAIAPALVLFVWSSTLGTSDNQVLTVAAFAVAAGVFLVAQNVAVLDRRRSWLAAPRTARARWLVPAAVLGVFALGVGILLGPAVPGARGEPLLDFANPGQRHNGGRSYNTSVPPLLDVGAKLKQLDNVEVFRVRAGTPDYWRLVALDDFSSNGGAAQWTLSAQGSDQVRDGLPSRGPRSALEQRFDIGPLGERWLPAAYRPVAASTPALVVVASDTLVAADADSVAGMQYTVDSELAPTVATLTAVQKAATANAVPKAVQRYTALPRNMPTVIASVAKRVVTEAGAQSPYDELAALRDYFRGSRFTYDTNIDSADDTNAIVTFLNTGHGFCVQFASTYAVMARSLGIPARVAVGFTQGLDANGVYHVHAHDAHAWPEVYLSGLGWTHLFDPTPAASGNRARGYPGGSALVGDDAPAISSPATTVTTAPPPTAPASPSGGTGAATPPSTTSAPATPHVSTSESSRGSGPWLLVFLVLAAVVAMALAYVLFVTSAKSRRRARRRATADPALALHGAWEEALDRLDDARIPRDPALTPLELARSAPRHGVTAATRPLRALARSYSVVRYGETAPSRDDVDRAWQSVDEIDRALEANASRRERWRRRLDPTTLRPRARR